MPPPRKKAARPGKACGLFFPNASTALVDRYIYGNRVAQTSRSSRDRHRIDARSRGRCIRAARRHDQQCSCACQPQPRPESPGHRKSEQQHQSESRQRDLLHRDRRPPVRRWGHQQSLRNNRYISGPRSSHCARGRRAASPWNCRRAAQRNGPRKTSDPRHRDCNRARSARINGYGQPAEREVPLGSG